MDPARAAALVALRRVRRRDAYANLVVPALLRERGLHGRSAAAVTDLVYGTLRGLGTYDRVLGVCTQRPLASTPPDLLDALRLGAYQLLSAGTPAHAAVSTTVDLVRGRHGAGAAGFVNAVLRHVAGADLPTWAERVAPAQRDRTEHLAVAHLHPRWVVQAFSDVLGDGDRLVEVLAADNVPPKVTLAALPGRCERDELARAGAQPGRWARTAAVLPGGDPREVAAVAQGRARVQDEGSQVVALALADAAAPAGPWADVCAGPGGKAALLAAVGAVTRQSLVAAERLPHRAGLVRQALAAAGLRGSAGVVQADGTAPPWRPGTFAKVLVDAPCTGLGALRRRPEARWRRTPADLDDLVPLQQALLARALDSLAPAGVCAYVTCSPHTAETEQVVAAVVGGRRDVTVLDAPSAVGVPDAARGPYLQLWPDRHGTDAMFLALVRRGDAGAA